MASLSHEQTQRYARHLILDEIGISGQEKLLDSSVLIVGLGGLGSPVSLYLAAAGIGHLGLIDNDCVDITNLQRQICHSTHDLTRPKVLSAEEKLLAINPEIKVTPYQEYCSRENIRELIREYDFIVDGADNFDTKFLINDACVLERKSFSHGGVLRFAGQALTVLPGKGACYRCVFKKPPPPEAARHCSHAGILGAVPGILGSIQATESIKALTGIGELLLNRLLTFDALNMEFREVELEAQADCDVCGENATIKSI